MNDDGSNIIPKESHLDLLVAILDNPENKILPLLHSNNNNNNNNDNSSTSNNVDKLEDDQGDTTITSKILEDLLGISKTLFLEIESLGKQYDHLHEHSKKKQAKSPLRTSKDASSNVLSGLPELHIPNNVDLTDTDLPETVFGQIELQNLALGKLVKKSLKRLVKSSVKNDICVLDMGIMDSDSEAIDADADEYDNEDEIDHNDDDNDSSGDKIDESGRDGNFEFEEEERIRQRMERAMEDMEDEEELHDDAERLKKSKEMATVPEEKKKEELIDPIAEDMKDGFFDLNEMESFADEEEDYLPKEAFGNPDGGENKTKKRDARKKKSFHQRQREGLINQGNNSGSDDDDDDDDDDDSDDLYEKEVDIVRRKKYRDEEDIDALYNLYQETNLDIDVDDGVGDDDDGDDVVNMTAADFFGAPKKQVIDRYKKKVNSSKRNSFKKIPDNDNFGDDDDSWGEYDFEKEEEDENGWGADQITNKHNNDEAEVEDDEEELIEMKHPAVKDTTKKGNSITARKNEDKERLTKQEEKLRRQTDEFEKELINEKPWQMKGESNSKSRPVNSLLEGTPEFEMASKQAPAITVDHTIDLEEAIKQRILAEDWDDVVPRELPDVGWNKKRGELPEVSQEKSKLGLGELYEREYLKKAVGYDKDADEKQTVEEKIKDEAKQLFANLCSKLDALSNYHFAPRPISDEAEARVVTVPAIAMEEVLPLHVSDARGVAPEEVYAPKRGRDGILRADSEMDQNDRKRQRQSKKTARRKARKEKEADDKLISRLQPGLGLNNPYEKRKAREELSLARARGQVTIGETDSNKIGSSTTFFKKLQAEAQNTIRNGASEQNDDGLEKKEKSSRSSALIL